MRATRRSKFKSMQSSSRRHKRTTDESGSHVHVAQKDLLTHAHRSSSVWANRTKRHVLPSPRHINREGGGRVPGAARSCRPRPAAKGPRLDLGDWGSGGGRHLQPARHAMGPGSAAAHRPRFGRDRRRRRQPHASIVPRLDGGLDWLGRRRPALGRHLVVESDDPWGSLGRVPEASTSLRGDLRLQIKGRQMGCHPQTGRTACFVMAPLHVPPAAPPTSHASGRPATGQQRDGSRRCACLRAATQRRWHGSHGWRGEHRRKACRRAELGASIPSLQNDSAQGRRLPSSAACALGCITLVPVGRRRRGGLRLQAVEPGLDLILHNAAARGGREGARSLLAGRRQRAWVVRWMGARPREAAVSGNSWRS